MNGRPEAYSERIRLGDLVGDARRILVTPDWPVPPSRAELAGRIGQLEAILQMLADSAEAVLATGAGQ